MKTFAKCKVGLCVGLLLTATAPWTPATTIDRTPRPAILLSASGAFLIQDGWDSVALCRVKDGHTIHRFPAAARVNKMDATADEKMLLVACADGSFSVWNIKTGERLWRQGPARTGLDYVFDACFAWDGKSFIVCDFKDRAMVYETLTGRLVAKLELPSHDDSAMSAALAPDGSQGVLIGLSDRVYTLDVRTGKIRVTKMLGAWPIRYAANGKFAVCRSNNSGSSEQLPVFTLGNQPSMRDLGSFTTIGHIRPMQDSSFLVTGVAKGATPENAVLGMRCWPGVNELKELWRLPIESYDDRALDFDLHFPQKALMIPGSSAWLSSQPKALLAR